MGGIFENGLMSFEIICIMVLKHIFISNKKDIFRNVLYIIMNPFLEILSRYTGSTSLPESRDSRTNR